MNYRWKNLLAKSVMQICLLLFVVFLAFPLVWMLSTSLKPNPEIYAAYHAHSQGAHPEPFPRRLWPAGSPVGDLQQLKIGVSSIVVLILAVPAAYALVRFRTVINKSVMGWLLVSQLFPSILIIIPLFVLLRNLA